MEQMLLVRLVCLVYLLGKIEEVSDPFRRNNTYKHTAPGSARVLQRLFPSFEHLPAGELFKSSAAPHNLEFPARNGYRCVSEVVAAFGLILSTSQLLH